MAIIKRKQHSSDYVYTDGGVLVVKTPPVCSKWPHKFRMRIVAEYIAPKTLKNEYEYISKYVDTNYQKNVYIVEGRKVMVRQPFEPISNGKVVVLYTEVIDLARGLAMIINHEEPAMRMLITYSFLHSKDIGGVPKTEVYQVDIKC